MREQATKRLTEIGSLELRKVARAYGVAPHFFSHGKQIFLKQATLVQRIIEVADMRAGAEPPDTEAWTRLLALCDGVSVRTEPAAAPEPEPRMLPPMVMRNGVLTYLEPEPELDPEPPPACTGEPQEPEPMQRSGIVTWRSGGLAAALEDAIRAAVEAAAKASVSEEQVRRIVSECLAGRPEPLEIVIAGRPPVDVGLAHCQLPDLLRLLASGLHVWLAGPAGSGKTYAAEQAAKALGLEYFHNGACLTRYDFLGFVDANGHEMMTPFRASYERRALYLFDEIDRSDPSALLALNAALANGSCDFPGRGEAAARHSEWRCIAAGNTFGFGPDSQYVGALKQDAASLDRFAMLHWDYDPRLELALADNQTTRHIQELRKRARDKGLRVVISPRASIGAAALMAAGATENQALEAMIFAKLSTQDRRTLES